MKSGNSTGFLNWHSADKETVLEILGSSASGLTNDEAGERLLRFGANQIQRKTRDGIGRLLWRQINSPLIWVLIGSSAIAVSIGKVTDGMVVMAVVILNTIIGFIQEYKAGKAIEGLRNMVPENAAVLRNGQFVTIPVKELVPGDIVQISPGDRVPADMRLLYQKNLSVEEAALTGESIPSEKSTDPVEPGAVIGDRKCMVYSGTLASSGTATAVVVSTGMSTELGKISDMLGETTDLETPLTKKLKEIGRYLTIGILILTVIIIVLSTIRASGQGIAPETALRDSLMFAIALAVGAIPEGLPAVVTIALAIGVRRMARRRAIIRKLPSVETLGSTTVICTDKTGTLTRNELTVNELWTNLHDCALSGVGYNPHGKFSHNGSEIENVPESIILLLESAVLCSDADILEKGDGFTFSGDPTEVALVVAASKAGINADTARKKYPRMDVIPFDSAIQYMATLNKSERNRIIMKGAPEVILRRCSEYPDGTVLNPHIINGRIEILGEKGMRVLAVAQKHLDHNDAWNLTDEDLEHGFQFVGFLGMIDPPREEVYDAIKSCHEAGIIVKMITGDHASTARSIGNALGLSVDGKVVTGAELSQMDDGKLNETVSTTNIFARVAPEHKLKLVRALQSYNHVVAMTGDGVNDAPSLKQADIGVAMGITGTSVSKESADIVLADDNFSSITAAVEEGRRVYDNLLKSIAFLLPTNLGLALIMIYGILFFPFNAITKELLLPMLPTQLLWINMVAAVALALPLAFESKEINVMKRPPRRSSESLFSKYIVIRVAVVALLMAAGTIFLFDWEYSYALKNGFSPSEAIPRSQTIAVTFVIMFQVFYMINSRSLKESVFKIGLFSNRTIFIGIGTVLVLQTVFIYSPFFQGVFGTAPLDSRGLLVSVLTGLVIFPLVGLEKYLSKKYLTINS